MSEIKVGVVGHGKQSIVRAMLELGKGESENVASIKLPMISELESKTIEELSDLLHTWGPLYAKRFNLDDNDEYAALTHFYVSCSMMHENLANGWRRMWRITIPVTESRWEEEPCQR